LWNEVARQEAEDQGFRIQALEAEVARLTRERNQALAARDQARRAQVLAERNAEIWRYLCRFAEVFHGVRAGRGEGLSDAQLKQLLTICHPDKWGGDNPVAVVLSQQLNAWREQLNRKD
jgi:hypothetical protein